MLEDFIQELRRDYPGVRFRLGKKFTFRPPRTVIYEPFSDDASYKLLVLHELGHAVLEHLNYQLDIERIKMERAAWEKARELAKVYQVKFDEDLVEDRMDSYRDWLHQRSMCAVCGLTRWQNTDGIYRCPVCDEILSRQSD